MAGTDVAVKVDEYVALNPESDGMDLLREHLAENEVSEFDLTRIKVPTGGMTKWQIPTLDGDVAADEVVGVIVLSKQSRSYWEKAYSGGNEPPDCSAADAKHATKNNEEIEIPASVEEGTGMLLCDTCDYSEWGSAGEGKRGQACKLTKQLFVLMPNKLLPAVVSLPPTSLRPASKYFLDLADAMVDKSAVITRITLEKVSGDGVPDYARCVFHRAGMLEPEQVAQVKAYAAALEPQFSRFRVQDREEAGV